LVSGKRGSGENYRQSPERFRNSKYGGMTQEEKVKSTAIAMVN